MPLWFNLTAIAVVGIAALGMAVAFVGIVRASDRVMFAGGIMVAAPVLAFIFLAVVTSAVMALSGV